MPHFRDLASARILSCVGMKQRRKAPTASHARLTRHRNIVDIDRKVTDIVEIQQAVLKSKPETLRHVFSAITRPIRHRRSLGLAISPVSQTPNSTRCQGTTANGISVSHSPAADGNAGRAALHRRPGLFQEPG